MVVNATLIFGIIFVLSTYLLGVVHNAVEIWHERKNNFFNGLTVPQGITFCEKAHLIHRNLGSDKIIINCNFKSLSFGLNYCLRYNNMLKIHISNIFFAKHTPSFCFRSCKKHYPRLVFDRALKIDMTFRHDCLEIITSPIIGCC